MQAVKKSIYISQRGQFIDAEDFLPVTSTFPEHPMTKQIPNHQTLKELKKHRVDEQM